MKKLLLSTAALVMAISASAQLNAAKDGYTMDNTDAASQCNLNSAPNNGGIMAEGPTLTASGSVHALQSTDGPMTLVSVESITPGSHATWFGLPVIAGESCSNLYDQGLGINMSSNGNISVTGQADVDGAVFELFVGSDGQWFPSSSTYNIGDADGSSMIASFTFTTAGAKQTISVDMNNVDATVWGAWAGKSNVQSVGFRSATDGATFLIDQVKFGAVADGVAGVASDAVAVYPNPASDVVNVAVGSGNASVTLSSVTGSVVASATGSGTVALSTAGVPAGLYVVSVSSGSGVTTAKVVVK